VVDEIRLPKAVPSVSSTGRIHKVKRRQANTNHDRFERQLHREKEEDDVEEKNGSEQERLREQRKVSGESPDPVADEQDDNTKKNQGKLVDVVI
jgi:hypothetical protein